ncbi:hypothetical protein GGF31_001535 [Allomyces arbusculus]|nr:hypothetical protein GGF31_001535 [Allomyces arbusculus]
MTSLPHPQPPDLLLSPTPDCPATSVSRAASSAAGSSAPRASWVHAGGPGGSWIRTASDASIHLPSEKSAAAVPLPPETGSTAALAPLPPLPTDPAGGGGGGGGDSDSDTADLVARTDGAAGSRHRAASSAARRVAALAVTPSSTGTADRGHGSSKRRPAGARSRSASRLEDAPPVVPADLPPLVLGQLPSTSTRAPVSDTAHVRQGSGGGGGGAGVGTTDGIRSVLAAAGIPLPLPPSPTLAPAEPLIPDLALDPPGAVHARHHSDSSNPAASPPTVGLARVNTSIVNRSTTMVSHRRSSSTPSWTAPTHAFWDGVSGTPEIVTYLKSSESKADLLMLGKAAPAPDTKKGEAIKETPAEFIARMQLTVSRKEWGTLLGGNGAFFDAARMCFMARFQVGGVPIDMALRQFLLETSLPRESQQIERMVAAFAIHYASQNPDLFAAGADTAEALALALLMAHTSIFNRHARSTMIPRDLWIRSVAEGYQLPVEMATVFYDNIRAAEFVLAEDDAAVRGELVGTNSSSTSTSSPRTPSLLPTSPTSLATPIRARTPMARTVYRMVREGANATLAAYLYPPGSTAPAYLTGNDAFAGIAPHKGRFDPLAPADATHVWVPNRPAKLVRRTSANTSPTKSPASAVPAATVHDTSTDVLCDRGSGGARSPDASIASALAAVPPASPSAGGNSAKCVRVAVTKRGVVRRLSPSDAGKLPGALPPGDDTSASRIFGNVGRAGDWYLLLTQAQVLVWRKSSWAASVDWRAANAATPTPDLVLSLLNAVCLVDRAPVGSFTDPSMPRNTMRLILHVPDGRGGDEAVGVKEYVFQAATAGDVWDWVTKINYAAAMRTVGTVLRVPAAAAAPATPAALVCYQRPRTPTHPPPPVDEDGEEASARAGGGNDDDDRVAVLPHAASGATAALRAPPPGEGASNSVAPAPLAAAPPRIDTGGSTSPPPPPLSPSPSMASALAALLHLSASDRSRARAAARSRRGTAESANTTTTATSMATLAPLPPPPPPPPLGESRTLLLARRRADLAAFAARARDRAANARRTYRQLATLVPVDRRFAAPGWKAAVSACRSAARECRLAAVEAAMADAYVAAIEGELVACAGEEEGVGEREREYIAGPAGARVAAWGLDTTPRTGDGGVGLASVGSVTVVPGGPVGLGVGTTPVVVDLLN